MTVRLTPAARLQLLDAVAFIRADRPLAAREFSARVDLALRRLLDFPESGRLIPEFTGLDFREVLVSSYRLFYRIQGDVIWVVGEWRDAQLPDEPFEPAGD